MNKEVFSPENNSKKEEKKRSKLLKNKIQELLNGHFHAEYRVETPEENYTLILFKSDYYPPLRLRSDKVTIDEKNNLCAYPYVDIRFDEEKKIVLSERASIIAENGTFMNWPEVIGARDKALSKDEEIKFNSILLDLDKKNEDRGQIKEEEEFKKITDELKKDKIEKIIDLVMPITPENELDIFGRTHEEKELDYEVNSSLIDKATDLMLAAELSTLESGDKNTGEYYFETEEGQRARIFTTSAGFIRVEIALPPSYENGEEILPIKIFSLLNNTKTLFVFENKLTEEDEEKFGPRRPNFDSRATPDDQAFLAGLLNSLRFVPKFL